jgi:hypothetical protein
MLYVFILGSAMFWILDGEDATKLAFYCSPPVLLEEHKSPLDKPQVPQQLGSWALQTKFRVGLAS